MGSVGGELLTSSRSRVVRVVLIFSASLSATPPSSPISFPAERDNRMGSVGGELLTFQRLRVVRVVLIFSASLSATTPSSPIPFPAERYQNWISLRRELLTSPRPREVRVVLIFSASQSATPPPYPIPFPAERHQNGISWRRAPHIPEVESSEGCVDLQCFTKCNNSFISNPIPRRETLELEQLEESSSHTRC